MLRRPPFSENPRVGTRGQRTKQRIFDAALRVFGERGYHNCSVDRITELAGCSRVAFYQYFSSKEDLYRQLTGQVARQLNASTEALGMVDGTAEGWGELRDWVGRHTDIYARYEPVFQTFREAAETDEAVAGGSVRVTTRNLEQFCSKLTTVDLSPRQLLGVVSLLLECVTRTQHAAAALRAADATHYPTDRVADAVADVIHRTLFGLVRDVNVHSPAPGSPPTLDPGPVLARAVGRTSTRRELTAGGRRTLDRLLDAGRTVLVSRGLHRTRVDDIVTAAGVSHGSFYRYFDNTDDLAHTVAVEAMGRVARALEDMVALPGDGTEGARAALRSWLRRYNEAHAPETALIRVWVEASFGDPALAGDSAAVVDWGRRRMAAFLRPRGYGDVETEAVVMLSLLTALGAREPSNASIDAAVHIVERGLLAA